MVQSGSCLTPSASYVVCGGLSASGYYVPIVHYELPPFLLETACNQNSACAGYMATADATQGWLLSWSPAAAYGTVALRVDSL